jgi:hypothetical protein
LREKPRYMPFPERETKIAVAQEEGEKAVKDWTVIGRGGWTREWGEYYHRTSIRWAELGASMDVRCSKKTSWVAVPFVLLREWTVRGRSHAVGLQGGP